MSEYRVENHLILRPKVHCNKCLLIATGSVTSKCTWCLKVCLYTVLFEHTEKATPSNIHSSSETTFSGFPRACFFVSEKNIHAKSEFFKIFWKFWLIQRSRVNLVKLRKRLVNRDEILCGLSSGRLDRVLFLILTLFPWRSRVCNSEWHLVLGLGTMVMPLQDSHSMSLQPWRVANKKVDKLLSYSFNSSLFVLLGINQLRKSSVNSSKCQLFYTCEYSHDNSCQGFF